MGQSPMTMTDDHDHMAGPLPLLHQDARPGLSECTPLFFHPPLMILTPIIHHSWVSLPTQAQLLPMHTRVRARRAQADSEPLP